MTLLSSATLGRHDVTILFVSIAVLLGVARLLGEWCKRAGLPAVLGEIAAGILLGPTVFGSIAPDLFAGLFPTQGPVPISLSALTTVAISLFLLVAGMEVDLTTIWRQGKSAVIVGVVGMVIPFAMGLGGGYMLPTWFGMEPHGNHTVFALFLATALAITALPVIAKILMDLRLYRTDLGMVIVAAAIFNDLVGWIIFALLLGMMGAQGEGHFTVGHTIILTLVFAVGMLTIGRWIVDRSLPFLQAHLNWPGGLIGFALAAAILCAAFTEWIGVHAIFGAFLFGVALGDSRHLRQQTRATLDQFISFFFAPLFFATIGLRVNFATNFDLTLVIAIMVIATLGKVIGCGVGAMFGGFQKREAWAIGFGMNARGAMEIILGVLALEAGVIGERLFVALVLMAIGTSLSSGMFMQRIMKLKKVERLAEYLSAGRFRQKMQSTERRAAIHEMVEMACEGLAVDPAVVERRVWAREQLMPNGIGNGVAVPHARVVELAEPVTAVGFAPEGIDFNARDGQPARVICLLLTPFDDYRSQLDLLADVGKTFQDPQTVDKALESKNYTEFLAMLNSENAQREQKEGH